jgi:hypothetical protein
MSEPAKISQEDMAVAVLETALMAFAAREDLYIPRKHELAEFLWLRAVQPLLADAIQHGQDSEYRPFDPLSDDYLGYDPSEEVKPARHPASAAVRCGRPDPHDTHMWDPSWPHDHVLRCPGKD